MKSFKAYNFYLLSAAITPVLRIARGAMRSQQSVADLVLLRDTLHSFSTTEDPAVFRGSIEIAKGISGGINIWLPLALTQQLQGPGSWGSEVQDLHTGLIEFENVLNNELSELPVFQLEEQGNLSLRRLVKQASDGYPQDVLALLDSFIKGEIDEAGRCLAFARSTACGFHIFRSVEVAIKGYVYAATGKLPPMSQRNWGAYIVELGRIGASTDLLDLLKILKTKRNPLMHPQDTLELHDAIHVFCICESVTSVLVQEVIAKGLASQFTNALAVLPTI